MANPWDVTGQTPINPWAVTSQQPATPPPSTAEDVAKGTGSGLASGTADVLGMPQDYLNMASNYMGAVGNAIGNRLFGKLTPEQQAKIDAVRNAGNFSLLPTTQQIASGMNAVVPGATTYQPQTTAGKFAKAGAELVPAAATLSGARTIPTMAKAAVKYGLIPGLASEGAVEGTGTEGTPVGSLIRAGTAIGSAGVAGGLSAGKTALPTTDEIKAAAQALYKKADAAGLLLDNSSFSNIVGDIGQDLAKGGIHPVITPQATAAYGELSKLAGISPTLQEVDQARQVIGNVAKSADPNERRLAGMMLGKLDDYLGNVQPSDILAGDKSAIPLLSQARNLWKTQAKSDLLDQTVQKALTDAGMTDINNPVAAEKLRLGFKSLTNNKSQMRMFSVPERAAIQSIVRRGPTRLALTALSKFAPTGGLFSMIASPTAGFAAGSALGMGPIGAVGLPVAGELAKRGAAAATLSRFRNADALVRSAAQPAQASIPQARMSAPLLGTYSQNLLPDQSTPQNP